MDNPRLLAPCLIALGKPISSYHDQHRCIHAFTIERKSSGQPKGKWLHDTTCSIASSNHQQQTTVDGISWYLGLSSKVQNPRRLSSLEWTYNLGWVTNHNLASPTNGWKVSNCICNMITKHIAYLAVYIFIVIERLVNFLAFGVGL